MQAAIRLMTEAARYEAKTRRPLERLATEYFWRACGMAQRVNAGPLPVE